MGEGEPALPDRTSDVSFIDRLGPTVLRDLAYMFCGEKLGGGVFRRVYVLRTDPTKVVKIENRGASFCNILEWQTWEMVEYDKKRARWLAPCRFISPCGAVLIQDRTDVIREAELPKRIPHFLNIDAKLANWGMLKGAPVCHDYGCQRIAMPLNLEQAKW